MKQLLASLRGAARSTLLDGLSVSLSLFKVIIPVSIAVKILKELDLIQYLAMPLSPFMEWAGLPAETGLAWASALLVNIYSGIVVYFALLPTLDPMTVAQVTVLCSMMLIAHALPVELGIARQCGVNLWVQGAIRSLGALVYAILLHWTLAWSGAMSGPATVLWKPSPADDSLWSWAKGELFNLLSILVIVLLLICLMRILTYLRITEFCNRLLRPVLRLMGIGYNAATITVVGLVAGLTYGGGLIIHEAKSGNVSRKDLFSSLSLMGLSHSLIEDTLLMVLLGAHLGGVLWGRLLFSLLVVAVLARMYGRGARTASTAASPVVDHVED